MAELTYRPVKHRHTIFLKNAGKRPGFKAAYDALAVGYAAANEICAAGVTVAKANKSRPHFIFR